MTEDKDAVLSIADCGRRLCGRVVWVERPTDDRGLVRMDRNNPEAARQTRPVCGLPIISSLRRSGEGKWDGYIYNPADGQTYSGSITELSPDSLRVRAYSIFRLFGRSQTWTRFRGATGDSLERACRDGRDILRAQREDMSAGESGHQEVEDPAGGGAIRQPPPGE